MSTIKRDHPHVLIVSHKDPDDPTSEIVYDLLHPEDCPWSIEWRPTAWLNRGGYMEAENYAYQRKYDCSVAFERSENGCEDWPTEPGYYWFETWFHVIPSGPWGASEFDAGVAWHEVKPNLHQVLPLDPPGASG